MTRRLGDVLIDQGVVSAQAMESAAKSRPASRMLGDWLIDQGVITTEQLGQALASQFGVPYLPIEPTSIDPQIVRLLPEEFSRQTLSVSVKIAGRQMTLAMVAPDDIESIAEAELMTGYQVLPSVAMEDDILRVIKRAYDDRTLARQTAVDMKMGELRECGARGELGREQSTMEEQSDAPVVRLVQAILTGAVTAGASDIHLEPHKPEMRVRYRVDGELQQVMTIPNHIEESAVSRIKVMADMDTTDNRRPQDGHLVVIENGKRVGFRVSSIPTIGGQKLVLRLLDEGNKTFSLETLGIPAAQLQLVRNLIDNPYGMFVVTGPTGSGKSTTLYAVLTHLNKDQRNIVTVEDPVEYRLPGINQVQSDNEFGLGFANALKYIMRQDPDVIMLGEIRDRETAQVAVQAALTGHLLISTLHTNDAPGAVQRLSDLGVDSFKIAGSLLGSIAQRLLRSLCSHCKQPVASNRNLLSILDPGGRISPDQTFYGPVGCNRCLGTGYSGRMPIFEIMPVTEALTAAIESGMPHSKLRELATSEGMTDLSYSGLQQAALGKTSIEEVYFKTRS